MSKTVKFYFDKGFVEVPWTRALEYLRHYKEFTCAINFNDPESGQYVFQNFTLYPKPQKTYGHFPQWAFLACYQGLTIKVPADFDWWADHHGAKVVKQRASRLVKGEYVTFEFDVEIMAIRLAGDAHASHPDIDDIPVYISGGFIENNQGREGGQHA